ncbi:MAG: AmmeMemoRadiSam system protein B, partial [Deltaproteobacteria bacterium]|nr:AmmeMemoRadiSam system protein B [Deltaproteobacteria bacterium]
MSHDPCRDTSSRMPILAGAWYPAEKSACEGHFDRFEERAVVAKGGGLRAGVLPHAGWVFSGSIAYNVVRELARRGQPAETLVLFAGHLSAETKPTVMGCGSCWTPYGAIPVDEPLAQALLAKVPGLRQETPSRHSQDNSTEVQFPFLKRFFPNAKILLIGAPPCSETLELAEAIVKEANEVGREL